MYDPAPQPENRNRDLDPGYEEDPDIFVELEEGIFYQMSYEGTHVPISPITPASFLLRV